MKKITNVKNIGNLFLIIIVLLYCSSCTNRSGATMGLFTAKSPVAATISGDIFVGWAIGDFTGSGTISITSAIDNNNTCVGEFRYTSTWTLTGEGSISCKDGSMAVFNFKGLDNLRGYGYGNSSRGPVTFTYGMTADEASKYLQKPFPEVEDAIENRDKDEDDKSANLKNSIPKT